MHAYNIHMYVHTFIHITILLMSLPLSLPTLLFSFPPSFPPLSIFCSLPSLPSSLSSSLLTFQSSTPANFRGYEVLYWPISTTNYSSLLPSGRSTAVTLPLNSLRIFTRYAVAVRLYCSNGTGPASPVKEFPTPVARKSYQIHVSS